MFESWRGRSPRTVHAFISSLVMSQAVSREAYSAGSPHTSGACYCVRPQFLCVSCAGGGVFASLAENKWCHGASQVNDDEIERPWSKYSKGSSAHNEYERKKHAKEEERAAAEEERKKGMLNRNGFAVTMRRRRVSGVWGQVWRLHRRVALLTGRVARSLAASMNDIA